MRRRLKGRRTALRPPLRARRYPAKRVVGRKRRRVRRNHKRAAVILLAAVVLAIGMGVFWLVDGRVRPMLGQYGKNQAVTAATRAVNDAVERVLADMSVEYEELATVRRSDEEAIASVEINTTRMNLLKSAASRAVLDELNNQRVQTVTIPVGSLFGGLLTGLGPGITIQVPMNSTVETAYDSAFDSAGINQTRHLISLRVKVRVLVVIQGEDTEVEVETGFTLAESILVGEVPQWMMAQSQ